MNDMAKDPLFCGVFAGGLSYADRTREKHGDYLRLGFLCYSTLELSIESVCPPELAERILSSGRAMQARRGQLYETSSSGNSTVLLGSKLASGASPQVKFDRGGLKDRDMKRKLVAAMRVGASGVVGAMLDDPDLGLSGSALTAVISEAASVRAGVDVMKAVLERQGKLDDPKQRKASIDARNGALATAASDGDVELMTLLVAHGADPAGNESSNALYSAAFAGQSEAAEWLIDRGADPQAQDSLALWAAAKNEHQDTVKVLVKAGARQTNGWWWGTEVGDRVNSALQDLADEALPAPGC